MWYLYLCWCYTVDFPCTVLLLFSCSSPRAQNTHTRTHMECELQLALISLFTQVILATNIAESSVTIPKVAYVIDSCRSLQVFWDTVRKTDSAELVWVSKSQVPRESKRERRREGGVSI